MSPRLRNLLTDLHGARCRSGSAPGAARSRPAARSSAAPRPSRGAGTSSVIVNQTSDRAIVNWHTFNIATGGSATFNQPNSSSITLNRVTGGHRARR